MLPASVNGFRKQRVGTLPNNGDWQHWAAVNRQLIEQWRRLLSVDATLSPTVPPSDAEHFSAFAALSDDILDIFEPSNGCIYLSPNWQRLTGRDVTSCIGPAFYACLHPDHAQPFLVALQHAAGDDRAQLSLYPQQFMLAHADGRM